MNESKREKALQMALEFNRSHLQGMSLVEIMTCAHEFYNFISKEDK